MSLSRTSLRLENVSITPKMVKNVFTVIDSSNASDPKYILNVLLKKGRSELSYILSDPFNIY